jgi:serine/threonine protein kinase/WD40 repeat protein
MIDRDAEKDDVFAAKLAALHLQMANNEIAEDSLDAAQDKTSAEISGRLKKAKECLEVLSRVWPSDAPVPETIPERVGRFRVIRQLGFGGYGIVYQAFDELLSRIVALKVQRPEAMISAELRSRFWREASVAARLRHPNIVGVYEAGETGFQIWIATEYFDCDSLAAWLRSIHAPVSPTTAAQFVATVATALDYLHQHGVLHRDLKPSNILLDRSDTSNGAGDDLATFTPKIIDFGLAKLVEDNSALTKSGIRLGTTNYMSPGQASGTIDECGPETDIYSLGVIFYEILIGRPPFQGPTDLATLRMIAECEPVSPRKSRREIPRDLEAICLRCLEKNPKRRYASGAELAEDLRRFLKGEPTIVRPRNAIERSIKAVQRRPIVTIVSAMLLAGVILLLAQTWFYIGKLETARSFAEYSRQQSIVERDKATANEVTARKQEEVANRFLYASRMRDGYQWLNSGEVEEVTHLLGQYDAGSSLMHLRGFEWFYLKRRSHAEKFSLEGHRGEVYGVIFSPDGHFVLSGGADGTIKVWDPISGRLLKSISAHGSCVNSLAFSADGTILASASCDRSIKLWNASTYELLATLDGTSMIIECLAFSPSGDGRLASGGAGPFVHIWDMQSLEVVDTLDTQREAVHAIGWRSDGQALFVAADAPPNHALGAATLFWNLETNEHAEFKGKVNGLAVTHNASAAYLAMSDGTVRLIRNGTAVAPFVLRGHLNAVHAVAISPKGDLVASAGSDSTIQLWNTSVASRLQILTGHVNRVQSLAFSPQGSLLASASFDGSVKLWDYNASDRQTLTIKALAPPSSRPKDLVALSHDLHYAAAITRPDLCTVYDLSSGVVVGTLPVLAPTTFDFLVDSPVLFGLSLTQPNRFDEWDVAKWKLGNSHAMPMTNVSGIALSRNGRNLALVERAGATIIDRHNGQQLWQFDKRPTNQSFFTSPAVYCSPDGNTFGISLENEDPSWIVDVNEGVPRKTHHRLRAVANGARIAAVSVDDFSVTLIDVRNGLELARLRQNRISEVAFSPDSKTLAIGTQGEGVSLFNVSTGQKITNLGRISGSVSRLKFSANGRSLAAIEFTAPKVHAASSSLNDKRVPADLEHTANVLIWSGVSDE